MNSELEDALETGPERIKQAFLQWKTAIRKRQMIEKQVYITLKSEFPETTATELKYRLFASQDVQDAQEIEDIFEAELKAAEETHMSNKKLATLRGQF